MEHRSVLTFFFVNFLLRYGRLSWFFSARQYLLFAYRIVPLYPELRENALVERHLSDATPVAMCQRLWRAVAASHTDTLGQDLFKLRCRSTSYQRPYQRQRVIIEICLQRSHATTHEPLHKSL